MVKETLRLISMSDIQAEEVKWITPEILSLFISRIEVGERGEKYSRTAKQSIRIIYRDVGVMDSVEPIAEESENTEQKNIA